jgi:hypothetical protein
MALGESSHKVRFGLILTAGLLAACGHYYSKFNFRGVRNPGPTATRAIVIDSTQVRGLIRAEELRQAEENRRIRELPRPTPKDIASAKAWLETHDKLVDLRARAAFLSDLKAMGGFEVPATAQGVIVGWSSCGCTLRPGSAERLVKVRFKLRAEHRTVEGWICQDAIEMLHNFDL